MPAGGQNIRGRLANPGFENQPVKSAFFFTGNSKNGVRYYEYDPGSNMALYTIHPSDARHLGWSESAANREFAVDAMIGAGVNVIGMSSWGPRGTDNWAHWAPMQTSTQSHDELFDACIGKNILIAPYIETAAATGNSPGFSFMDCFPGDPDNPAPELVASITDLIDRYIANPRNARWPEKWAQAYDLSGEKRYMVSLIHVASNQDVTDEQFAAGFDLVASRIHRESGILVGFTLDVMPPDTYASGRLRPSPEKTGPWLFRQESVLAIQPFLSDISIGVADEDCLIRWKQQFASKWINTGIPFILDIEPGYDAHLVFPGPNVWGNNASWREALSRLAAKLKCQGVTFSAWNGYTEGYAGVPTLEHGNDIYEWAGGLFRNFTVDGRHFIPGRIEAEDYEQMSGVEKEISDDDGGGFDIGWLDAGDWLDYKVDVEAAGEYHLYMRIANGSDAFQGEGQIQVNSAVLASLSVPGTGGWQNWETVKTTCNLQAGAQTMRVSVKTGGWNINWMQFKRDDDFKYHPIPGQIEAECYDDMAGIRTEITLDQGGGFNTGWFDAGDWLDYRIEVKNAGSYDAAFRVALAEDMPGGQGRLMVKDQVLCAFDVSGTGGWQTWETIHERIDLEGGQQTLRLVVDKGPWNFNWMSFAGANSSVHHAPKPFREAGRLFSNHPNPFNCSTTIPFHLDETGSVLLKVLDIRGREVAVLQDGPLPAGEHEVRWIVSPSLPSGLYQYSLTAGGVTDVRKAMLLK